MAEGFEADCPEHGCTFAVASQEAAEASDVLLRHLEDAHDKYVPREQVDRMVAPVGGPVRVRGRLGD